MKEYEKSKYAAFYLTSAERDITDAVRYIAEDLSNPTAAENLLVAIGEKVKTLEKGYWRGQQLKTHSSGLFEDIDMNWCIVKGYYLFFKFDETDMVIRIYHFSHKLRGLHYILSEMD